MLVYKLFSKTYKYKCPSTITSSNMRKTILKRPHNNETGTEMKVTIILLSLLITLILLTSIPLMNSPPLQKLIVLLVRDKTAYILSTWLASANRQFLVIPLIKGANLVTPEIPEQYRILDLTGYEHKQLIIKMLRLALELDYRVGTSAILIESINEMILVAPFACLAKIPIIPRDVIDDEIRGILKQFGLHHMIYTGKDEDFMESLKKDGFIIETKSTIEILKEYNSRVHTDKLVISPLIDEFSFTSPLYAALKKWKLVLIDHEGFTGKGISSQLTPLPSTLVYVASPTTLSKDVFSVKELYRVLIELGGNRYLSTKVGLISAIDECKLSAYVLRLFLRLYTIEHDQRALLVFMENSMPLSIKIKEMLSSMYGYTCTVLYSEGGSGNITTRNILKLLREDYFIIYLNLHGNPVGMALDPQGPYVISAYAIERPIYPSIIITLSCETLNFGSLPSAKSSLALKFISMGAIAYVGAAKIELVSGEVSTGYPELIIKMLLDGFTLGEAVRVVNNIRIGEMKQIEPWRRAYTILIGDPDLKIARRVGNDYTLRVRGKTIMIEVLRETPILFIKFPSPIPPKRLSDIRCEKPNIFIRSFITKENNNYYMYMYVTRLYTAMIGNFKKGDIIRIDLIETPRLEYYLVVILIVVGILTAVVLLLRRIERKK